MTHEQMRELLLTKLPPPIVDRFFLNGKRAGWHERNFEYSLREYRDWMFGSPIDHCLSWCETAEGGAFWQQVHQYWQGRKEELPSVKGLPT